MDLLIAENSVPLAGADIAPTVGTPQYATDGNPATGAPATTLPAYWINMVQAEIHAVLIAAGLTPNGAVWTQLSQAIGILIEEGSAAGTYMPVAGGTFTGPVNVGAAAPGTMEPIPIEQADGRYIAAAGGGMTGPLTVQAANEPNEPVQLGQFVSGGSGTSWSVVLPNGFIMQGGQFYTPSDGSVPITFPIPFTTTKFGVSLTVCGSAVGNGDYAQIKNTATQTGATILTGISTGTPAGPVLVYWEAKGY